jgi:hypothetical protein
MKYKKNYWNECGKKNYKSTWYCLSSTEEEEMWSNVVQALKNNL